MEPVMDTQDLLSKLERPADVKCEVDCTLKLVSDVYLSEPQFQFVSASCEKPQQEHQPACRDFHAGSTQATYNRALTYGAVNTQHYGPAGRIQWDMSRTHIVMPYMNSGTVLPSNHFRNPAYMRTEPSKKCMWCGTNQTPVWRRGSDGDTTLCNACGIRYQKQKRKRESGESSKSE